VRSGYFLSLTKGENMRMLSTKHVMDLTGLSRVTIWRYEQAGIFPKRRQLGPRRVGWIESEVLNWMESRTQVDSCESEVSA
jgi:prophage regulatory protein